MILLYADPVSIHWTPGRPIPINNFLIINISRQKVHDSNDSDSKSISVLLILFLNDLNLLVYSICLVNNN